jgi:hypothetical protein
MQLHFVEIHLKLMVVACANASLSTEGQSITLVYVDATRGWKNVQWIQHLMLQDNANIL